MLYRPKYGQYFKFRITYKKKLTQTRHFCTNNCSSHAKQSKITASICLLIKVSLQVLVTNNPYLIVSEFDDDHQVRVHPSGGNTAADDMGLVVESAGGEFINN